MAHARAIQWSRRFLLRAPTALILLAFPRVEVGIAQDIAVPPEIHLPLLAKAITFDRSFVSRSKGGTIIGIVYQSSFRASVLARDEASRRFTSGELRTIGDTPVMARDIDLSNIESLDDECERLGVRFLYLCPLRAVDLSEIIDVSREKKILTVTGVPEYVYKGIALGIGTRGNRPLILVNIASAKAEGSDFVAQLLNLAEVVP